MEANAVDATNDAEMPDEVADAWANVLIAVHARFVDEADEFINSKGESEPCESNSNAHPC